MVQKSGSPVKHTALWTSALSFSWMSSAAVCGAAPTSWVCFLLAVGSRMWIFHYTDAVSVQQHCKVFWEGCGRCDTFSSLFLCSMGVPGDSHPSSFCLLCLSCPPGPTAAEDGGAPVNSITLLVRTLQANGGETDTNLLPALPHPNWGRVVVKWSGLCFGEEGKDRVCCRSVLCRYWNIVMLRCIIPKCDSFVI